MKLLLTGFEPFGGDAINPSWEAVCALDGWRFGNEVQVHVQRLCCVFGQALQELDAAIDRLKPQLVIAVGQAGGRSEITPERIAINIDDGRICDNAGCQPIDQPVVPGAPAAYFSTLPIKAIVQGLRAAGIPASVSNSAGTFVCNHLFYGLMHRLAREPRMRGGFIHLPYLPEQVLALADAPSLPLATMVEALRIALRVAAERVDDRVDDVRVEGGALH